jgi:hypothetical protein
VAKKRARKIVRKAVKRAARKTGAKPAAKSPARRAKAAAKPKPKRAAKAPSRRPSRRREVPAPGARRGLRAYEPPPVLPDVELGPDSGGQSGDLEGLPRRSRADSQSVAELIEEGQSFEAGVVSGVEEADDAEGREVTTREVPEDDVPPEYLDQ